MLQEILQPEVQAFIRDHAHHDPFALALQAKKYPHLPIKAIAEQIAARQKARHKLPEWEQKPQIVFPSGISIEQSSSEITAKYKSTLVRGKKLIDLTGGMGVDTFYLASSFTETHYVEKNTELAETTRHNFNILGKPDIQVHTGTADDFLEKWEQKADVVYIDPDRRPGSSQKTFSLADASPNVLEMKARLLQKANSVLIKTSPLLDIDLAVKALEYVQKVYVVAVDNDCKEVLYLLQNKREENPEIIAINLSLKGKAAQEFSFTRSQEKEAVSHFSEPFKYIYEPNAAIRKAGAFKTAALKFSLQKLHPNSHLYTADEVVGDFPGRAFVVKHICPYNKKRLKECMPEGKANIATRNFPDSVQRIRKKMSIKEGGSTYVFATILSDNRPVLLITKKYN